MQNRKYNQIESIHLSDVIANQWILIRNLQKHYENKVVPNSAGSFFHDDSWNVKQGNGTIYWSNLPHYVKLEPAFLLLKIATYCKIQDEGIAFSTIVGRISHLTSSGFFDILIKRNILCGNEGQYVTSITDIYGDDGTWFDVLNLVDTIIQKGLGSAAVSTLLSGLEMMLLCPPSAYKQIPFFNIGTVAFPWKQEALTTWIKKRFRLLDTFVPQNQPYESLPAHTVNELIGKCFEAFDFEDEVIEFTRLANESGVLSPTDARDMGNGNPKLIDDFIDNCSDGFKTYFDVERFQLASYQGAVSFKYYKQSYIRIINLYQIACTFIIMFTTGLRNCDVRQLQRGSCVPSGRVDMLYYMGIAVQKTGNHIHIPVPSQTHDAILRLERLYVPEGCNENLLLINYSFAHNNNARDSRYIWSAQKLNLDLKTFCEHHGIAFLAKRKGSDEASAHCIRATTAGWLGEHSKMAILLVQRLFGHTNKEMPRSYLYHNPLFQRQRALEAKTTAERMAELMVSAAAANKISGFRGEDLERGFQKHKNQFNSLTEGELRSSFSQRISRRIISGEMYAFLTPLTVICTRNPNDPSQTPCARTTNIKNVKEKGIEQALLDFIQTQPEPDNCVGKKCAHAVLGPWSVAIKESFLWYSEYLEKTTRQNLDEISVREHAKNFVDLYASDVKKIFGA